MTVLILALLVALAIPALVIYTRAHLRWRDRTRRAREERIRQRAEWEAAARETLYPRRHDAGERELPNDA